MAPVAVRPPGPAPVRPSRPPAVQPVAMQPVATRPRPAPPPAAAAPEPVARADDVVCARCGVRSARDRRFCCRCGASLVEVIAAPPPPPLPRWRRILQRRHRKADDIAEGGTATPRPSRVRRSLAAIWQHRPEMLAAAGLLVLVIGLNPAWRNPIAHGVSLMASDARRAVAPSFLQVMTPGAQATDSLPGHPAGLAVDTGKNTYWSAPAPVPGVARVLTVTFDHPVDVDRVGFTVGGADAPALGIPQSVHLVFTDGSVTDTQLLDTRDFQLVEVNAHHVTGVQIHIVGLWQQRAGAFGLAEVEFWERR